MSAGATTARHSYRRRRKFLRIGFTLLGIAAASVGALVLHNVVPNSSGFHEKQIPLEPDPPTPKTVKLDAKETKDIRGLIRQFVDTAVARKHLAESYRLIGPGLREDISLKQWVAGNMTVVPYPVDAKTTLSFAKPDFSYARSVRLQVHVITPDRPIQTRDAGTEIFFVDLIRSHGRWLVNNWVPRWSTPLRNSYG